MNNMKIFRANPGEGKTKWLFERAVEENLNGKSLYYVGTDRTMESLVKMWEATFHEKCPMINWCDDDKIVEPCCFFTDEMFENLLIMDLWITFMKKYGATWYITVDKECFVN